MSQPQRQRVVLSQRHGARMVRTRVEVQEQTEVGDALVRGLIRAQLLLSVRLAVMTLSILFAIPLLGILLARFTDVAPLGIGLPWLVLGVAIYPLLFGVGRAYVRRAERNETEFVGLVED